MHPLDGTIQVLLVCGGALYLAAGFAYLLRAHATRAWPVLFAIGWIVNASIFVLNGVVCGQPPFGNMYHVQVFLALCFLPLYLLVRKRDGLGFLVPHFSIASALPLIGACFMERDIGWHRMPALQSPWFVPHVVGYMVSYALATVAFAVATSTVALWAWRAWTKAGRPFSPAALLAMVASWRGTFTVAEFDPKACYRILLLGFPFMTFGLLSGALWAEEAWGVYWSWDSKEVWSLITWMLYLIYFHCRRSKRLRKYAMPAQLLAFTALIVTFLLVNLLPKLGSALHSYS
ncbi:MAG: cytochrome c biogenesis protein CcsA [Lentisphaeria bacterium]|nr:cytochrome c biogenesis protein CcsA [Lentisphaeria bacterium]